MMEPARAGFRGWAVALWLLALPVAAPAAMWPLGAQPAARKHVVEIRGFVYSPSSLTVGVGDTVVWINRDIVPHTATAESKAWDTGTIEANSSRQHVFTRRGQARYLCALHPTMRAVLTVR